MSAFRAFIAIPLPEGLRTRLASAQETLRPARAGVTWVDPGRLHVTLKFLGDLSDEARGPLEEGLRRVAAAAAPIDLEARGLGAFPASGTPRVVWAGLEEKAPGRLAALARGVEEAAAAAGFPPEGRPFAAHVTLGRVKSPRNAAALRALIEAGRDVEAGAFRADAFVLFRSDLSPQGPTYTDVAQFKLGA
jgi:RNA 2',3'-cyclic 3'-phosphodiesterase